MTAVLLILGGAIFGMLGGLHAIYTLLDIRNPRRLVPVDPSVAQAMCAGCRMKVLPVSIIMPLLTLLGCVYEVLALLYWFWIPAVGVVVGTVCFAVAWLVSLR